MPTQTCSREQELTVRILLVNIQTQSGPEITDGVLTIRKDVVQQCDAYKDRKALRHLRFLEANGLLESKAETTENGTEIAFKPTE